jgi:hypothetical protein
VSEAKSAASRALPRASCRSDIVRQGLHDESLPWSSSMGCPSRIEGRLRIGAPVLPCMALSVEANPMRHDVRPALPAPGFMQALPAVLSSALLGMRVLLVLAHAGVVQEGVVQEGIACGRPICARGGAGVCGRRANSGQLRRHEQNLMPPGCGVDGL